MPKDTFTLIKTQKMKFMKRTLLIVCAALIAIPAAFAQETAEVKKKIKIITIDEDGNKKEIVKELPGGEGDAIEWVQAEEGKEVRIIIKKGGEEEEVIVSGMPTQMRWHMQAPMNKAYLGVYLGDDDNGATVKEVTPETPAAKAGLQKGDIITAVNGEPVETAKDLVKEIAKFEVGESIELTYLRDGKTIKTSAQLAEREEELLFAMPEFDKDIILDLDEHMANFEFIDSDDDRAFLGIEPADEVTEIEGVMIMKAVNGSPAAKAGLQTGDIITAIDGASIKSFDDLVTTLKDRKAGDAITVTYKRQGKAKKATITLSTRGAVMEKNYELIIEEQHEDED